MCSTSSYMKQCVCPDVMDIPDPPPAGHVEAVDDDLGEEEVQGEEEGDPAPGEVDGATYAPGDVPAEQADKAGHGGQH